MSLTDNSLAVIIRSSSDFLLYLETFFWGGDWFKSWCMILEITDICCFLCSVCLSSFPERLVLCFCCVSAGRERRKPTRLLLCACPPGWPPPGELAPRCPLRQPAGPREGSDAWRRNGQAGAVVHVDGFSVSRKGGCLLLNIHNTDGLTFRRCWCFLVCGNSFKVCFHVSSNLSFSAFFIHELPQPVALSSCNWGQSLTWFQWVSGWL